MARAMRTIKLYVVTALFGIFLETNKHQNLMRLRPPIVYAESVAFKEIAQSRGIPTTLAPMLMFSARPNCHAWNPKQGHPLMRLTLHTWAGHTRWTLKVDTQGGHIGL